MSNTQFLITAGALALGTILTRFLPFILFPDDKPIPDWVRFLADRLPYASLGMLVVYALKDTGVFIAPFGAFEVLSLLVITLVHQWKHNTLLSIGSGVACYLLLVNFVMLF
jgi:branched-subunit amino acid transport protein AzlD